MCTDCYNNCGGNILSDKCVKYTGPDIEFLGIETGDQLSQVEAAVIAKLETSLDGTGITFAEFIACSDITTALNGKTATLDNLVQAISDVICDLKADVAALDEDVDPPLSISAPCLTLEANPTRDQILQAIATKLCAINTTVTTISTNYVTTDTICALVTECLAGSDTSAQEYSRMPKYVALPYHGPLSVFDAQGKGLSSAGYDKVYICNGQTVGTFTTPDYRGRSPLGANNSIPGGALEAAVDPALAANAGYSFVTGTKKGGYTDTLTIAQLPAHSHTVTDPGHRHNEIGPGQIGDHAGGGAGYDRPNGVQTNQTSSATTGISIGSSGSNSPHNTTHPVIGSVFIMFVP